jgi:hypothetical protein
MSLSSPFIACRTYTLRCARSQSKAFGVNCGIDVTDILVSSQIVWLARSHTCRQALAFENSLASELRILPLTALEISNFELAFESLFEIRSKTTEPATTGTSLTRTGEYHGAALPVLQCKAWLWRETFPGYRKPASRSLHCGNGREVSEKGRHHTLLRMLWL